MKSSVEQSSLRLLKLVLLPKLILLSLESTTLAPDPTSLYYFLAYRVLLLL